MLIVQISNKKVTLKRSAKQSTGFMPTGGQWEWHPSVVQLINYNDPLNLGVGIWYKKTLRSIELFAQLAISIMKHWDTVAIVGVGLIGASIGLALRERGLAKHVIGIGRNADSLRRTRDAGAVSETTTSLTEGVSQAQLVIVCTPVDLIVEHVTLSAAACPPDALITDAGSTKAQIVKQLKSSLPNGVAFVGSHPLAGSEKTGAEHARADLFDGRVVVVTPTKKTSEDNAQRTADVWSALGASVMFMSPAAHDKAVAATSHLPHVLASALARITMPPDMPLTAGGWRDTTRIAGGDGELWTQILGQNRDNVLSALSRFEKSIAAFRSALEKDNPRQLTKLLTEAKRIRDAVGS